MGTEHVVALLLMITNLSSASPVSSGCQCAIRKVMSEIELLPCPRVCSLILKPVCGFNPCEDECNMFRTFNSVCELDATICDGPGHLYYKMYEGRCIMDHQDDNSCLYLPD